MKEILIKAITEAGAAAINKNYSKKLSVQEKVQFKLLGYQRAIISQDPFIAQLTINNPRFETEAFLVTVKKTIMDSMPEIKIDVDYKIEEKA